MAESRPGCDGTPDEALLMERQRHTSRAQEGAVSAFPAQARARHPVSAGDQGAAGPDRDRSARISRVLELRSAEGLFGYGPLLERETRLRDQRIPARLRPAVPVRGRAAA